MQFSVVIMFAFTLILCHHLARSEDHHKRAPSGFTGVRGKKSIPDGSAMTLFYEDDADEESGGGIRSPQLPIPAEFQFPYNLDGDIDKRAPSMGFVGMRGKKPWEEGGGGFYGRDLKRAPSGFFGMRGKKNDEIDSLEYDLEKRMNSGFFGMRGKKDDFNSERPAYFSDKRAPSMGFVGMRGRRTYDDISDLDKRAPSGFFGMRGKKQWTPFSLRGKKIPYQFRSKFVGVRGKKTMFNKEDGNFETDPYYDVDMNQLIEHLLEDGKNANTPKTGQD